MRMKGGVRRFQTGGANPRSIANPGLAAVMNSPQMQANLAAAIAESADIGYFRLGIAFRAARLRESAHACPDCGGAG